MLSSFQMIMHSIVSGFWANLSANWPVNGEWETGTLNYLNRKIKASKPKATPLTFNNTMLSHTSIQKDLPLLLNAGFTFNDHLKNLINKAHKQQIYSGNYRVWIHSETRTWHDKNMQSTDLFPKFEHISPRPDLITIYKLLASLYLDCSILFTKKIINDLFHEKLNLHNVTLAFP